MSWSPEEDALIRERYVSDGAKSVAGAINREPKAVWDRARRLGVKSCRHWTEAEDCTLRLNWGEKSIKEIALQLGRSIYGVYDRAYDLDLPLGCPQGFEFFTAAAKRTGFTKGEFSKLLRYSRVEVRPAMSRPSGSKTPRASIVEPDAVDEAVRVWMQTETLAVAADRHGVAPKTLERWLMSSGLHLPKKPKHRRHWRIPSETIDAAAAMRAAIQKRAA
jgi:hypothetical protein